jgi:hypothetical protein
MKIKKTIGYVLALLGFALFTGILVEDTGLKAVIISYAIIISVMLFITLILWLIDDD